MTSALKKWGQIDSRIKYFIATGSVNGYTLKTGVSISDFITVTQDNTVLPDGVWDEMADIVTTGGLLKDLGRMVTVYDDTVVGNPHTAIYRQVQVVNGSMTEGVSGTPANGYKSYWIKVWSASGLGVATVARTG